MKVLMSGPSMRVILAVSAAVWAVGCGKKSSSPEPAISPVAVAPNVAGPQQAPANRPAPAAPAAQQQPAAPAAAGPLAVVITNKASASLATKNDAVTLTFNITGLAAGQSTTEYTFQCKTGSDSAYVDCTGVSYFTFGGLVDKTQYTLSVQAIDKSGAVIGSDSVTFTASVVADTSTSSNIQTNGGQSGVIVGGGSGNNNQPIPKSVLIGQRMTFTVPVNSHVTEYVSQRGYQANFIGYRVSSLDDPFYAVNTKCSGDASQYVPSVDPAGGTFSYCQTAISHNNSGYVGLPWSSPSHIEVGTNPDVAKAGTDMHVDVDVYDYRSGFRGSKSQFWTLCSGGPVTIIQNVWVMQDFWGKPVAADVAVCRTYLTSGSNLGTIQPSYIATFILKVVESETIAYVPCFADASVSGDLADAHPRAFHASNISTCENAVFSATDTYSALVEFTMVAPMSAGFISIDDFAHRAMQYSNAALSLLPRLN